MREFSLVLNGKYYPLEGEGVPANVAWGRAFFCGGCGEIWARVIPTNASCNSWSVCNARCAKCSPVGNYTPGALSEYLEEGRLPLELLIRDFKLLYKDFHRERHYSRSTLADREIELAGLGLQVHAPGGHGGGQDIFNQNFG